MRMKYARVENEKVMEIIDFDPTGKFHPDIEKQFIECDDTVKQKYTYKNKKFEEPVIVIEVPKKSKVDKLIDKLISKGILADGEVD